MVCVCVCVIKSCCCSSFYHFIYSLSLYSVQSTIFQLDDYTLEIQYGWNISINHNKVSFTHRHTPITSIVHNFIHLVDALWMWMMQLYRSMYYVDLSWYTFMPFRLIDWIMCFLSFINAKRRKDHTKLCKISINFSEMQIILQLERFSV